MFLQHLADQVLNEQESLTLTVIVSSKVDASLTWYFNDEVLKSSAAVKQAEDQNAKVYVMTIDSITAENGGKFSVKAENKAGSTTSSCMVKVNSMYHGHNHHWI